MPEFPNLFSDDEMEALVKALARGRYPQTFTEEDAVKVHQAAQMIRLEALYLNLALKGVIKLDIDHKGDIIWIYPEEESDA